MDSMFEQETSRLRESWQRIPAEQLDSYMVQDVEDPRINAQSILLRALLADTLFPGEFTELIDEELRFSVCINWVLSQLKKGVTRQKLARLVFEPGTDSPEVEVPWVVRETVMNLRLDACQIPDYLLAVLSDRLAPEDALLPSSALGVFELLWRSCLDDRSAPGFSVLEVGCGSANDYRLIDSHGIGRLVRYTGLDLCEANIINARARFPEVSFEVGNALELPFADGSFDYLFVQDLLEHLSLGALDRCLDELLRVVGTEVWLGFFNLADIPEHEVYPVELYHRNRLSLGRIKERLERAGTQVEVVQMAEFLKGKFDGAGYYNPQACTLVATR